MVFFVLSKTFPKSPKSTNLSKTNKRLSCLFPSSITPVSQPKNKRKWFPAELLILINQIQKRMALNGSYFLVFGPFQGPFGWWLHSPPTSGASYGAPACCYDDPPGGRRLKNLLVMRVRCVPSQNAAGHPRTAYVVHICVIYIDMWFLIYIYIYTANSSHICIYMKYIYIYIDTLSTIHDPMMIQIPFHQTNEVDPTPTCW